MATKLSDAVVDSLTVNHCVGLNRRGLSPHTNWYCIRDVPPTEDTRCEYCRKHIERMPLVTMMVAHRWDQGRINCDTDKDPYLTCLEWHGFQGDPV